MKKVNAKTLREDGLHRESCGQQHSDFGHLPLQSRRHIEAREPRAVKMIGEEGTGVIVGFLDGRIEVEQAIVEFAFKRQRSLPQLQIGFEERIEGCSGYQCVGSGKGVFAESGADAMRSDSNGNFQRIVPSVVGVGIVGPEKGGGGIAPKSGVGDPHDIRRTFITVVAHLGAENASVEYPRCAHTEGVGEDQRVQNHRHAVGTHGVIAHHQ